MFFKMEMGGHFELGGQDIFKNLKKNFIGFATPKIVEFSILCICIFMRISCLGVSKKLSYFF